MSYAAIVALYPGERKPAEEFKAFGNSHGSAPPIWDAMCREYYGTKEFTCMFDGTLDKLWPRWKDLSIPEYQRAVLMMTYDYAYVAKKDYARAAKDIRQFVAKFLTNTERVNHWPRIAEIFESDPDIPAFGFYMTSITDNPFCMEFNEDTEAYEPPEWDKCFDIYAELDQLRGAKATP